VTRIKFAFFRSLSIFYFLLLERVHSKRTMCSNIFHSKTKMSVFLSFNTTK